MIVWKKYDPKNPPEFGKQYLVSDGRFVDIAIIYDFDDGIEWCPNDFSNIEGSSVTHFAEMNLPLPEEGKR